MWAVRSSINLPLKASGVQVKQGIGYYLSSLKRGSTDLFDHPGNDPIARAAPNASVCALCVAVADAMRHQEPFLYNRKLLETSRFVVLPSVGPLAAGHVMVVSKVHCESLASMGPDAIQEYDSVAARLRTAPFLQDGGPLEAEHGSSSDDKAGACVIHTHVHWLPSMGRFLEEFRRRLPRRPESSLLEVCHKGGPYLFARAGEERAIFQAHGLRSQTIRRILCEILDRDDTDWTQAPRLD